MPDDLMDLARQQYEHIVARTVTRLRRMADDFERRAQPSPNQHTGRTDRVDAATTAVDNLLTDFANLRVIDLVFIAAQADHPTKAFSRGQLLDRATSAICEAVATDVGVTVENSDAVAENVLYALRAFP